MDENKQKLIDFLDETEKILESIVKVIKEIVPDRKDVHPEIEKSWEELKKKYLPKIKNKLEKCKLSKLEQQGLTGIMLELKIKEFNYRKDHFERERGSWLSPGNILRRFIKNPFSKIVTAIDNILDSLTQVVGITHALKEFKDTLNSIIE